MTIVHVNTPPGEQLTPRVQADIERMRGALVADANAAAAIANSCGECGAQHATKGLRTIIIEATRRDGVVYIGGHRCAYCTTAQSVTGHDSAVAIPGPTDDR